MINEKIKTNAAPESAPAPDAIPPITTKYESRRGCGYRKGGGIYLISDGIAAVCNALPLPLKVCPCCGGGIKFSRGFTWITPKDLFPQLADCSECPGCFFGPSKESAGLLWVGEKFYTTHAFLIEAAQQGISRRIATVPHGFEVGKTWIYFAHKKAIPGAKGAQPEPGIFSAFCPARIEYVVTGRESEDDLIKLGKRGLHLVDVKKAEEQTEMDT